MKEQIQIGSKVRVDIWKDEVQAVVSDIHESEIGISYLVELCHNKEKRWISAAQISADI